MDDQLVWTSAWELRERLASGDVSAIEVVEAFVEHIERTDPQVHAFVTVAVETARIEARAADDARREGRILGALHGLPVVVKDDLWTAGVLTTGGSLLYEDWVPTEDAVAVARVRAAGGIILGKTNLPEFAMFPRSANLVAAETRNPWDHTRTSGGSSGGSAAALAAGMAPLAIGTDGGGSIRLPAALCGVVGMLPTPGRIPNIGNLDHCVPGPMARDVRDLALLLDALAGPDPRDPNCISDPAPSVLADVALGVDGLRVGWAERLTPVEWGDPRVVAAAHAGAARLSSRGADVEPVDVPLQELWWAHRTFAAGRHRYDTPPTPDWDAGQARRREPGARARLAPYLASLEPSPPPTREEFEEAMRIRESTRAAYAAIFRDYAVVASPTIPSVAPAIPEGWESPFPSAAAYTVNTVIANFAGFPAVSVPVGIVDDLPVAVQLLGPPGAEALVVRVAAALEHAVDRLRLPS